MKTFLTLALIASSLTAWGVDLKNGQKIAMSYQSVSVYAVTKATLATKFTPQGRTSMASYSGKLQLTLNVEGNICDNSAPTLGTTLERTSSGQDVLKLLIGKASGTEEVGCLQYSKPVKTVVDINIDRFYPADKKPKSYFVELYEAGEKSLKEVRVEEIGGKLTAQIL